MPARACDVFLIAVYVLERDNKSKFHMADISQWFHLITLSRLNPNLVLRFDLFKNVLLFSDISTGLLSISLGNSVSLGFLLAALARRTLLGEV
jgi:hypothetical protein